MTAEVGFQILEVLPYFRPYFLGPNSCFWQRKLELMLCTKFEVATFNSCKNK